MSSIPSSQAGFSRCDLIVVLGVVTFLATLQMAAVSSSRSQTHATVCRYNLKQLAAGWLMYAWDNNGKLAYNTYGGGKPYQDSSDLCSWVTGWLQLDDLGQTTDNTNLTMLVGIAGEPTTYIDGGAKYRNPGLIGEYTKNPGIYRCPADAAMVTVSGKRQPRVRSYSLNNWVGTSAMEWGVKGNSKLLGKLTDMTDPPPGKTFTFIDEREDSINDGLFYFDMQSRNPGAASIVDYPADWHDGGANLAFADGHIESWLWHDVRTMPPHTPGRSLPLNIASPNNADMVRLSEVTTGFTR